MQLKNQIRPSANKPLLSICCITYNHGKYIRDAIEGFLMQDTNFPIEVLINDDASTDNTADIIKEYEEKYPGIIFPIYQKENQKSKGVRPNFTFNYPRVRGKYIALCEGDDYWIDPYKLQKQFDFLEENIDYGLVATDFNILHQEKQKMEYSLFQNNPQRFPVYTKFEDFLVSAGYMAPCTWLFRTELLPKSVSKPVDGSFVLLLDFFANSKVYVRPETTSVYRKLQESASHSKAKLKKYERELGVLEIQLEMHKRYSLSQELKLKILRKHYHKILPAAVALNRKKDISQASFYLESPRFLSRNKLLLTVAKIPFGDKILSMFYFIRRNSSVQ